ncbi:MAG: hypothetical protein WKF67_14180 [Rubrobacteraceae bacterium]
MIEKSGIPTVSVTMLREVTEKINPPRALFVDTPLGYPLGRANDPDLRKEIIGSALSLLDRRDNLPIINEFPPIQVHG